MNLEKAMKYLAIILGVSLTAFQLYTAAYMPFTAMIQRSVHLALGLGLLYLIKPFSEKEKHSTISKVLDTALSLLALITCFYVSLNWDAMSEAFRLSSPTKTDMFFAVIAFLLVLEGTRRVCGLALPIVSLVALSYIYLGPFLPGLLNHPGVSFKQVVAMGYMSTEGIYSSLLGVSTGTVFIFIVFGQVLQSLKGSDFFLELANSVFGHVRGGPAKVAIFGSALFGSISGSAVANVVGTGSVTIPLMKRVGFKPYFAGAVESVASTGGLIMPPVMGAAAFIMAEVTGHSYLEICKAALLPAICYYVGLYYIIDLRARKNKISGLSREEIPDVKKTLKERGWIYLPPLAILVYILAVLQYAADKSCFYTIVLLLVLACLKKELRDMMRKNWLDILYESSRGALVVIMACACAGFVLLSVQVTGLGLKMSAVLIALAGNNMLLLLVLVMLSSIILGMGLPASACYIILAVLSAPAIVQLGAPVIAAHMFVMYFGSLSAITPPVAMAAYAAAGIAKDSPMKIGFTAWRIALPIFLIAFCFVFQPEMLMIGTPSDVLCTVILCLLGVFAMASGLEGYLLDHHLGTARRALWVIAGAFLIWPGNTVTLTGVIIAVACLLTDPAFIRLLKNKFTERESSELNI